LDKADCLNSIVIDRDLENETMAEAEFHPYHEMGGD
jgi:hypothetical protein